MVVFLLHTQTKESGMQPPKSVTKAKAEMTPEAISSEKIARLAQDGVDGLTTDEADGIIARHNADYPAIKLCSRTNMLSRGY